MKKIAAGFNCSLPHSCAERVVEAVKRGKNNCRVPFGNSQFINNSAGLFFLSRPLKLVKSSPQQSINAAILTWAFGACMLKKSHRCKRQQFIPQHSGQISGEETFAFTCLEHHVPSSCRHLVCAQAVASRRYLHAGANSKFPLSCALGYLLSLQILARFAIGLASALKRKQRSNL